MPIDDAAALERAMAEYQRLADAPPGSSDERRRRELDADIKAYAAVHGAEMRPAKPEGSIA